MLAAALLLHLTACAATPAMHDFPLRDAAEGPPEGSPLARLATSVRLPEGPAQMSSWREGLAFDFSLTNGSPTALTLANPLDLLVVNVFPKGGGNDLLIRTPPPALINTRDPVARPFAVDRVVSNLRREIPPAEWSGPRLVIAAGEGLTFKLRIQESHLKPGALAPQPERAGSPAVTAYDLRVKATLLKVDEPRATRSCHSDPIVINAPPAAERR